MIFIIYDATNRPELRYFMVFVNVYTSIGRKMGEVGVRREEQKEQRQESKKNKRKKPRTRNVGQDQIPRSLPRL